MTNENTNETIKVKMTQTTTNVPVCRKWSAPASILTNSMTASPPHFSGALPCKTLQSAKDDVQEVSRLTHPAACKQETKMSLEEQERGRKKGPLHNANWHARGDEGDVQGTPSGDGEHHRQRDDNSRGFRVLEHLALDVRCGGYGFVHMRSGCGHSPHPPRHRDAQAHVLCLAASGFPVPAHCLRRFPVATPFVHGTRSLDYPR